jgi:putative ABC transport system permease protein
MWRAAWTSLLARKARLIMSASAIVIGVAFVAGSFIFTDMLGKAFNGIMNGTVADVNVQPKGQAELAAQVITRTMTTADVERLRQVPGVASAYGMTYVNDAYLIGKDGKVLATQGAPAVGGNWVDAPAYGGQPGLVVKSGRAPSADHEVALDPASLSRSGYRLGDTIRIATSGPESVVSATIVGTVLYGSQNSTGGATYAVFSPAFTQRLFSAGADVWQGVWVTAAPGVSPDELAGQLNPLLPNGFEAVTGKAAAAAAEQQVTQALSFVSTFLLVFAGISLVVGSFLVVNTFSILVAQRSRELALLRALGASRRQVRTSVLLEAFVIGLVGATLGLAAGLGLARLIAVLFSSIGLQTGDVGFTLAPRTVLVSYAVGLLVTMAAAYLPARRASRVPPVAAMSGAVLTGNDSLGRRLTIGVGLTGIGAAGLGVGLFFDVPQRIWFVGAGALVTLLGVSSVSPVLGRPVIWGLGRGYRAWGAVGRLAELNAVRNPRRTAATASALMIGLSFVTTMSILAASAKATSDDAIRRSMTADYTVQNVAQSPFSTSVADRMAAVPGVAAVHRLRWTTALAGDTPVGLAAIDPSGFGSLLRQRIETGSLADFRDGTLIVDADWAKDTGTTVGDTITLTINGRPITLPVVATFSTDPNTGIGNRITTLATLTAAGMPAADNVLAVSRAPGSDAASVRAGLDRVVADLPMVTVADKTEYAAQQAAQLDQMLSLIYALLALAIVIAALGIVNTLALSVIERTREIGLLRAIGLTRPQLRRMIRLESVAIALLGSVLGVGMGIVFGTAIQRSLAGQGLELVYPIGQIVAFLGAAALIGVAAAAWPAWRAGRLQVLTAIATE